MKSVTNYFRNAVLASRQEMIEYKNKFFEPITWQEVESGKVNSEVAKKNMEK